jgi:hypothetical protein
VKILKVIRVVIAGIIWAGVYKLISVNRFNLAMSLFNYYEKISINFDEESYLMKGYLLVVLGHEGECQECFEDAVLYMDKSKKIKDLDKRYLKNYIHILLKRFEINFGEFDTGVDLQKVTSHYRELFPYKDDFYGTADT